MVSLVLSASTQAQNLTDSGVLRMERKFNRVLQMVHSQITTNIDYRQVNRMVENYGCYCFPNRGNLGSSGPAQDEYDGLCRDLYRCYRCIARDFNGFESWHNYMFTSNADGSLSCDSTRNTAEMRALCECDASFATSLGAIWDDNTYDYTLWNRKGNNEFNFDYSNVCIRGEGVETDACCGSYPQRKPYSTVASSCCSGHVHPFGSC